MSLVALVLVFLLQPQSQAAASVEGIVVRAGTTTPVAGARVSMGVAQTTTDPNGSFMFRNVEPGRYRLVATHIDYVPTTHTERKGAGRIAELTVGTGDTVKNIVLVLTPNGAISGYVYDSSGKAISGATIEALKPAYQDGRRILVSVSSTQSNKSGEYTLFSLGPGPYIVRATGSQYDSATSEIPLPVYFPNTSNASMASVIDLPPGVNFTGIDVTITPLRSGRIAGLVRNRATGEPAIGAAVTLVPRRGTVATGTLQRAKVSKTGTFELRQMAPGSYDLIAAVADPIEGHLAASLPVDVTDMDVDDVTLFLQPQLSVNGRIRVDNNQPAAANVNMRMQNIRVELRREPYIPELLILVPTIGADGTFTFGGITPGDYQLRVSTGRLRGYTKSASFGSIDALNPPFHIDGPGQFEIVISLNSGSLDTIVLDQSQKPFPDATVALVPEPPGRQRSDLYYSGISDASGRLHFDSVAPGDYRVYAWEDVPADAWQDPDFIRLYEDRGRRVRVSEGGTENLELKVIPQ